MAAVPREQDDIPEGYAQDLAPARSAARAAVVSFCNAMPLRASDSVEWARAVNRLARVFSPDRPDFFDDRERALFAYLFDEARSPESEFVLGVNGRFRDDDMLNDFVSFVTDGDDPLTEAIHRLSESQTAVLAAALAKPAVLALLTRWDEGAGGFAPGGVSFSFANIPAACRPALPRPPEDEEATAPAP